MSPALALPVRDEDLAACPGTDVLRRVGDKWRPLLLCLLAQGPIGFNALDRAVPGLSRRMLTRTLRGLERDGLIRRTVHAGVPPRVDYAITDAGDSLRILLAAVAAWAGEHAGTIHAARASFDAAYGRAAG
jgi:DNA-binding HxlR family transcriptional regulator